MPRRSKLNQSAHKSGKAPTRRRKPRRGNASSIPPIKSAAISSVAIIAALGGWFAYNLFLPESVKDTSTDGSQSASIALSDSTSSKKSVVNKTSSPPLDLAQQQKVFHQKVLPLLETYCYDCHGDGRSKGGLDLEDFGTVKDMLAKRDVWAAIRDHVDWKLMPPVKKDQPTSDERQLIAEWIEKTVFHVDPNNPDPGPITARRLNVTEYENTIHELLDVRLDATSLLPPDDSGHGFDNNASALTLAPVHLEKYLQTAEIALKKALPLAPPKPKHLVLNANKIRGDGKQRGDGHFLFRRGMAETNVKNLKTGRYTLKVYASEQHAGDDNAELAISVNRKVVKTAKVKSRYPNEEAIVIPNIPLSGSVSLSALFTNDFYNREKKADRNVMVHKFELIGPLDTKLPSRTAKQLKILPNITGSEDTTQYTLRVLTNFAEKAFRRPVTEAEIRPYLHFLKVAQGKKESYRHGIRLAMNAMLVSPHFLFIDAPSRHASYAKNSHTETKLIDEHTLASRIAYFLWSSMPDEELLSLAAGGKLRDQLEPQVQRMLKSPKAKQFIENFAGQWLQLRDLDVIQPDSKAFPEFDKALIPLMQRETYMMLEHILLGNLPVTELLSARYSFLNAKLAQHYGISGVSGDQLRKVTINDTKRGGLLTQGSILMLTSTPTRTSPVMRGKFVLDNILDTPPPAPPSDIPELQPDESNHDHLPLRKQLEIHRKNTDCAACHNMMDPVGFAFQNFNAIGQWREYEDAKRTQKIDSTGTLFTGESFKDSIELRTILAEQKQNNFVHCLSKKMLTYALGRGVEYYDKTTLNDIQIKLKQKDLRSHQLILAIIQSAPFQRYRASSKP